MTITELKSIFASRDDVIDHSSLEELLVILNAIEKADSAELIETHIPKLLDAGEAWFGFVVVRNAIGARIEELGLGGITRISLN